MDAFEYGFDAQNRLLMARATQAPKWHPTEIYYEHHADHVLASCAGVRWRAHDISVYPRYVSRLDFDGGRLVRTLQAHHPTGWVSTEYFWKGDDLAWTEENRDGRNGRSTICRYQHDAAGLVSVEWDRDAGRKPLTLWLKPSLRPDPIEAKEALLTTLLPAVQQIVADLAGGLPVRRVAIVCTDEGTHDGGMPPIVFVGTGEVGDGPPAHWSFADHGVARTPGGMEVERVCEAFNSVDWKEPGRLSGQAAAELAYRIQGTGLTAGATMAPDFICFAATPEGKLLRRARTAGRSPASGLS